jgi:1,2-phenylacetyl-CoA epoxidase catalytic subunit
MSKYALNFSNEDGDNIVAGYDTKKEIRQRWISDLRSYLAEHGLSIDDGTAYFQVLNKDGDYDEIALSDLFGRKAS